MYYAEDYERQDARESVRCEELPRHPRLTFLAMAVGLPICVIFAVIAATAVITVPVSLLMGWI